MLMRLRRLSLKYLRKISLLSEVSREVMIHDAVDDMPEEFRAHGVQKVVFRLEVGIKSAPPDIRAVDDGLYGNA